MDKRIVDFKGFLKEEAPHLLPKSRKKRLNESDVKIQVDWWDQAIAEVLQDIKDETLGVFTWESIIEFVKTKNRVLGRDIQDFNDDTILMDHLKDLIFQHHGDSFNGDGWFGDDNSQTHTKGVVIEQLAKVILDKIKEKTQNQDLPQKDETTVNLKDRFPKEEPIPVHSDRTYDDEYCEDLPWEYDSESRRVVGFERYSLLKESQIAFKNHDKCLSSSINKIEDEIGTLNLDDIFQYLKKNGQKKTVYKYVWDIVEKVFDKEAKISIQHKGGDFDNTTEEVMNQAYKLYISMTVSDILDFINLKTGMSL